MESCLELTPSCSSQSLETLCEMTDPPRPSPYTPVATPDPTREYQQAMLAIGGKLERALSTVSDRRVNHVWEYTQSVIAVFVVGTTCGGVLWFSKSDVRMPPEWWTIVGLVIGFYFGRIRPTAAPSQRVGIERERSSDKPTAQP